MALVLLMELQVRLFGMDRKEEGIKALRDKMLLIYGIFKENGQVNTLIMEEILSTKQVLKTIQTIIQSQLITPLM